MRAGLALVILALALIGLALGVPGSWIKVVAFGTVVADALIRSRKDGRPAGSLTVDGLAAGLAAGIGTMIEAPIAAFVAYALAAAMTFGGLRTLITLAGATTAGVAVRIFLDANGGSATPPAAVPLQWLEAGVYLTALGLTLTAAGRVLQAGQTRQEAVLATERRASEMKNEFVSMVTHELRTPLTNIAGFAMTVKDSWRDLAEEEIDEFLRIIVDESELLANLVDDVLAIPRLEAGRLLLDAAEFPLRPAAYKIADLLFPAGGAKSASVSIGGNVQVVADPNRVEQVLRNLLENARKYGGDHVTVEAVRRDREYVIVIADNGPGVPVAEHDRIFTPFEQGSRGDTRAETGFGLGLAVARHLVEAMGGRIWYENGFPVGARFCFTLPAAAATEREVSAVG
ncbi:MAG TPA: HAMP domain-containing sensor histidine kinase [Acidimicrobiia bacterium]|nr:HAMP domain-containing sensor histidine kinase [Acidimicrobiia bacterium]